MGRVASQHQDLWSVVLDMLLGLRQVLDTLQGVDKDLSLGGAAPVSLGLPEIDLANQKSVV